jgi:maltose-binding protein MalE
MPFNPSPTGYFPGLTTSSSGVFIPYTALESYKVNTSGDVRQLAYSFLDAFTNKYNSLLTADKTDKIAITSSWTAQSETVLRKVYNYSFNLAFSGISVQSE